MTSEQSRSCVGANLLSVYSNQQQRASAFMGASTQRLKNIDKMTNKDATDPKTGAK